MKVSLGLRSKFFKKDAKNISADDDDNIEDDEDDAIEQDSNEDEEINEEEGSDDDNGENGENILEALEEGDEDSDAEMQEMIKVNSYTSIIAMNSISIFHSQAASLPVVGEDEQEDDLGDEDEMPEEFEKKKGKKSKEGKKRKLLEPLQESSTEEQPTILAMVNILILNISNFRSFF